MLLKLKALEETRSFYKVELKKEGLTKMERNKYLLALKAIDKHIKRKQNSIKSNKFNEKGR
ncbi:hypothetical protein ES708_09826 [subsurface metagenome]